MNIECPTTRWRGNPQQNREKKKQSKKIQLDNFFLKECKRAEIELEIVDIVSYSVFWGISYTVFWGLQLNIIYMLWVV